MYAGEQCSGVDVGDGACGDSTHPSLCVFFPYPFHEMGLGMGPDNLALCSSHIRFMGWISIWVWTTSYCVFYKMGFGIDPYNILLCVLPISHIYNGFWSGSIESLYC